MHGGLIGDLPLARGSAPRVTLVFVWIFSDLVDRAFGGFLVPLLGLLLLPYTTLFCDLGHLAGSGYSGRRRYA